MNLQIPVLEITVCALMIVLVVCAINFLFFSESAKDESTRLQTISDLPKQVKTQHPLSAYLGWDSELKIPIYFPNSVRSRHVHIVGATGSGKTEGVLLNLIDQDLIRSYPIVILDAKGDQAFVDFLNNHPCSKNKLLVFDTSKKNESSTYNPLASGTATDAVLRLFNSMTWSEEFYKTKARDVLMKLAALKDARNETMTLGWLREVLSSSGSLGAHLSTETQPLKITENEYGQISGLIAQVNQLCHGGLGDLISGKNSNQQIVFENAIQQAQIIYFRLPALLDPVTTATIGRLVIADLAFYAAKVQSGSRSEKFTPIFLDEFGSLACAAFLELIAKARSAGLALHFSHQSLGDLKAAGDTFASQISDNSSTKIVLRIYDPDTADNVARTFGTIETLKETKQIVTNDFGSQSETGVMAVRDTREFRCSPDNVKSLPTGCAYVLMNHALRVDGKSGDVFRLRFPRPPNYQQ